MKRAYIPLGADQQGRYETGQWLPRRVDPDSVDTKPAPMEAAHGCYEPPEDRACEDGGGVAVWLVIGVAAVCGLALALHVAAKAGLL